MKKCGLFGGKKWGVVGKRKMPRKKVVLCQERSASRWWLRFFSAKNVPKVF